jgi:hypothetical protein
MRHRASRKCWQFYRRRPDAIRHVADANYVVLKQDPKHPLLHFTKAGRFWSVRVGIYYRAVAVEGGSDLVWLWIGHHSEYERLLSRK